MFVLAQLYWTSRVRLEASSLTSSGESQFSDQGFALFFLPLPSPRPSRLYVFHPHPGWRSWETQPLEAAGCDLWAAKPRAAPWDGVPPANEPRGGVQPSGGGGRRGRRAEAPPPPFLPPPPVSPFGVPSAEGAMLKIGRPNEWSTFWTLVPLPSRRGVAACLGVG